MKSFGNIAKDGQVRAVASGTLTDGTPVVVNADGTVSVVSQTSVTQSAGTAVEFHTAAENSSSKIGAVVYDSTNNKHVIFYRNAASSSYGTAIVGTVSGNSISFGTPVVFESATTRFGNNEHTTATFIDGKIVVVYGDGGNSQYGTAIVGTVSGTSISFGSAAVFNSGNTYEGAVVCTDTTNNKVIVAYRDEGNSNYGVACVGTVSGTSISFGSEHTFRSTSVFSVSIGFDQSAGAAVVAYRNSSGGQCNVCLLYKYEGDDEEDSVEIGGCSKSNNKIYRYMLYLIHHLAQQRTHYSESHIVSNKYNNS